MIIAYHYGGTYNGTKFQILGQCPKGMMCRPVSWGPGIATHVFPVSSLEIVDRQEPVTEHEEGILQDLEGGE